MRRGGSVWLAAVVGLGVAGGAKAVEGRFVGPDGAVVLTVEPAAERGYVVRLEGMPGEPRRFDLQPAETPGLLVEPTAPRAWYQRLLGGLEERLPFDGERVAFAHQAADELVVTTLTVDRQGRPTLERFAFVPSDGGGLLSHQRITGDGIETFAPIPLVEATP